MSRGGSGFPIIIAVLGVLILTVIGIFIWMQLRDGGDNNAIDNTIVTMEPTPTSSPVPTQTPAPEVTPEPVVTVPPATPTPDPAAATPTPYVTAAPNYTTDTVWINVDALKIHTQANFESDTVGKIPYGQSVQGDVNGKWMNTSYDGITGWIYLGKTSAGRACVVYSEGALQALEPDPDAAEEDLVDSHSFSESGSTLTLTITFTTGVYADDDATGNLQTSDFSITDSAKGTIQSISHVAGSQTAILTIFIDTASSNYEINIKAQSVFKAGGNACTSQSFTHP